MNRKLLSLFKTNTLRKIIITAFICGCSLSLYSQGKITGKVSNESGTPVAGVSVVVKGTNVGVSTGTDGSYSINTTGADNVLVFSMLGFVPQEFSAGGRTVIDITLVEEAENLEEIVVVGYGVQRKRDLTGAVSSVKMGDAPVGTFSTASHALAGKAAGLRVTQATAQPGAGASLRIRGATSINASNEPLIIIDGFPVSRSSSLSGAYYEAGSMDNALEMINPADIESIEVLKDASATAIYGSRAGHGVIIVTTKRGKEGKLQVSYSGNVSMQTMANQYEMLDAAEYMKVNNMYFQEMWRRTYAQGIYAGYITPPATFKPFEQWMAEDRAQAKLYSAGEIASAKTTDWMNEITRTGIQHSHNLSLNGGNDKSKFLASLNYFDQQGILKNSDMNRLTLNLNNDYQISKYVKAGLSLNLSRNQYSNVPLGMSDNEGSGLIASALFFDPGLPVRGADGKFTKSETYSLTPNPVSLLEITDNTTKDRVLSSGYLLVEPISGLTLKGTMGFDRRSAKRKNYIPSTTLQGERKGGIASQEQSDGLDYLLSLTANYMKTINKHSFTILAGYEYQRFTNEWFRGSSEYFSIDGFLYNNMANGTKNKSVGSSASRSALASVFGRLNYSFDDKYLLTATVRTDGASNFNPGNRWGIFPSVSAGWRFTEESFMESIKSVLSNGKLRAGYGQTGNSSVGNRTQDYFGSSDYGYVFGNNGAGGIVVTNIGNPAITWETTTEWNIGLELGLVGNRINLSMEYYNRVISDLLATLPLPSYGERTSMYGNIGSTQGKGIEITLNTVNIQRPDFVWTSDLTYYHYEDRWKERSPSWNPYVYENVNDPIRAMFYYRSNGLLKPGEAAPEWQPALLPGQVKIKNLHDEEGNPNKIDQYDRELVGSSDPDFSFGFNNTLRWKNFDFNIYLYGEFGRWRDVSYYDDIIPYRYLTYSSGGRLGFKNLSKNALNSWTMDNQNTSVPNILAVSGGESRGDYFLKKVSYLRCRNITLGYTIPALKKYVGSIRVNFSVNNPFVISNWNGLDPETDYNPNSAANNLSASYPNVRTFSFGLDVKF